MFLITRQIFGLSVDGSSRRDVDEMLHIIQLGALDQIERADDVHIAIVYRVGDRPPYIHLRGMMINDIRPLLLEDLGELRAPDIHLIEHSIRIEIRDPPR